MNLKKGAELFSAAIGQNLESLFFSISMFLLFVPELFVVVILLSATRGWIAPLPCVLNNIFFFFLFNSGWHGGKSKVEKKKMYFCEVPHNVCEILQVPGQFSTTDGWKQPVKQQRRVMEKISNTPCSQERFQQRQKICSITW